MFGKFSQWRRKNLAHFCKREKSRSGEGAVPGNRRKRSRAARSRGGEDAGREHAEGAPRRTAVAGVPAKTIRGEGGRIFEATTWGHETTGVRRHARSTADRWRLLSKCYEIAQIEEFDSVDQALAARSKRKKAGKKVESMGRREGEGLIRPFSGLLQGST